jgi:hypothetical protein
VLGGGAVEVHEDGKLLPELANLHYELRRRGGQGFLHVWSEQRNLVRRVLRLAEQSADRVLVEVQRFGAKKPGRLEIVRAGAGRTPARLGRERFRSRFAQLLTEQFPDETADTLTTAPDLEHSFSGSYTRGLLHRGQRAWAVLAVSQDEHAATIDAALAFGLLWLDWCRQHAGRRAVEGLRLFLPAGSSRLTVHRLQALETAARIELFEWPAGEPRARRLDPADLGNVETWLTPRREVKGTLAAARTMSQKITALAPDAIDAVVPPGTREVAWRCRGLEFARWSAGRIRFGLGEERCELDGTNWEALGRLVGQLDLHRRPLASDTNHPLFRAAGERWLETLVLAEPTRVEPHLDPRHLYSQVPAFSASDRGVIDLLGATRDGRLAVIELKVSEDLLLPLQAVDYWLRVRWHHREGDFPRYGYFTGIELRPADPLLFLVAPGLRFHPATDVLLRFLSAEIKVFRIGLNETWRQGLQVVFRQ